MIKFQEIKIDLTKESEKDIIDKITENLDKNVWERNFDSEKKLTQNATEIYYCFDYYNASKIYAKVWITRQEMTLWISNILPQTTNTFTMKEFNEIARLFSKSVLDKNNIEYSISKEVVEASDLLSEESLRYFQSFSRSANRSTGRSHPCDEERWFKFIYSTLKNGEKIDSGTLKNLLMEDGWDEETSFELSLDFEYGRDAMKFIREV